MYIYIVALLCIHFPYVIEWSVTVSRGPKLCLTVQTGHGGLHTEGI